MTSLRSFRLTKHKHMILRKTTIVASLLIAANAIGQTTFEEMSSDLNRTGGVYYAYPTEIADNTPAPKGYKPFYISHYGRHGSRYLLGDNDYMWVSGLLHKANDAGALTPLGINVMHRLDTVVAEARRRGGDLSPLGARQHREIAGRMYDAYPEVFRGKGKKISARSTLVPRCIISMGNFCQSLLKRNPELDITLESSERYMPYLCYSTPESDRFNGREGWWREVHRKFEERHIKPDRIVKEIFSDKDFVDKYVRPADFMWGLYWVASDAQNSENKISFYDVFTPRELFDIWQCFNSDFYARHSNFPGAEGKHLDNAKPLLRNFLEGAENAIDGKGEAATLRFGHDGNVVPFTALLHFENCYGEADKPEDFYKVWNDWRVSPMAANIQMVLFRNEKNPSDILVKFLHNEKETRIPVDTDLWPYYHWSDVSAYYRSLLDEK